MKKPLYHPVSVFVSLILLLVFATGVVEKMKKRLFWKNPKTSNKWKKTNLISLRKRLNKWQLEAFDKSYHFKIENGISLIKYHLLELKK